ncbi:MAG: hypothetical protein L3J24_04615 [Xanthomonadales bacterium]|nr:hypothetical protein [Xanthomonadales bacterium]
MPSPTAMPIAVLLRWSSILIILMFFSGSSYAQDQEVCIPGDILGLVLVGLFLFGNPLGQFSQLSSEKVSLTTASKIDKPNNQLNNDKVFDSDKLLRSGRSKETNDHIGTYKNHRAQDGNLSFDHEYRERLLTHVGPISEVLPDLLELANADAKFKLFSAALTFCGIKSEHVKDFCPQELKNYKHDTSYKQGTSTVSIFHFVKKLANDGSVMAMSNLMFFVPSAFKDRLDMERNLLLRIQNADVVTEYYQSVRKFLGNAANSGYPNAMLSMVDIYLSGSGIVGRMNYATEHFFLATLALMLFFFIIIKSMHDLILIYLARRKFNEYTTDRVSYKGQVEKKE